MRNERLQGYLIHHRKYRERSHIIHLFTQEYGRMDGVLRHTPPPQYQPLLLQASGKSALKNFTQVEILNQPVFFHGDAFFAGFYLNEVLLRLCPIEESMPATFEQYHVTLNHLQQLATHPQPAHFLKHILRQFEHVLLQELGYAIDFSVDAKQQPIQPDRSYQFQLNDGFIVVNQSNRAHLSGAQILSMCDYASGDEFDQQQLSLLGKLYRQMISSLLGDRPLQSRQLWIQNFQSKK